MNDRSRPSDQAPSRALTALTVGRLLLVPALAVVFMAQPAVFAALLLIFMFADLFDGVLARRLGADGPGRRAQDSIVDRFAIDVCLVAAALVGAMPVILVCAFLARDLYCAALCGQTMRERRVAIKADLLYRGLNCTLGAWAMSAPFLSANARLGTAVALLAASLLVAADLTRSTALLRQAPATVRGVVVSATALRRREVDWGAPEIAVGPGAMAPMGPRRTPVTA